MARTVSSVDRSRLGVPAKAALGDASVVVARKGAAHVLELKDVLGRLATKDLGRVLVNQVITSFDRVIHVEIPRIFVAGVVE